MDGDGWVRARTPDQIQTRVNAILEAARDLLEDHSFDEISLVLIAKQARFTRSNLYRYFATKEEVFLEILKEDLTDWVAALDDWFTSDTPGLDDFARGWIDSILKQSRMLGLLILLGTKLETGTSVEALTGFKKQMSVIHLREIRFVRRVFPTLSLRDAHLLILLRSSLIVGAYPAMYPTVKQIDAANRAGIHPEGQDYRAMMIGAIGSYLRTLTAATPPG